MRTPEICFGAIIRPIHFCLPSDIIWGDVSDCSGLTLGIEHNDGSGWAYLRTPDSIDACADWLDGLWLRSCAARRAANHGKRTEVGLTVRGIFAEFGEDYPGSDDLKISATVSPPEEDFCVYLGRTPEMDDDEFGGWDTLMNDRDMRCLAGLLRDVATAMREKRFHYGRHDPMRQFTKGKPALKPLALMERRAA